MSNSNKGTILFIGCALLLVSILITFVNFTEYEISPLEADFSETPHYKIDTYDDTVTINLNDIYGETYIENLDYMGVYQWQETIYTDFELIIQSRDFIRNGNLMGDDKITIKQVGRGEVTYNYEDVEESIPFIFELGSTIKNPVSKYEIQSEDVFSIIEIVKKDIHPEPKDEITFTIEYDLPKNIYLEKVSDNMFYAYNDTTNDLVGMYTISEMSYMH